MTKAVASDKRPGKITELTRRDGDRCYWCGSEFDNGTQNSVRTIDHRVPRALGGTARLTNLVLACSGCNHNKGNMGELAWLASARLQARRVGVFRRELRRLGYKDDGAYWHRGRVVYVSVDADTGWGVSECTRCGARGLPAELGARPCLLTAE